MRALAPIPEMDQQLEPHVARLRINQVRPLAFVKQIITMVLAVNDIGFAERHPALRRFVLERDQRGLPGDVQVYLALFCGPISRRSGVVAISPVPIIAVILMLFSDRATVNGWVFLFGWVLALAVVSTVVFLAADQSSPVSSSSASDGIAWGKIVLGVLLLVLAARNWRNRPRRGEQPAMPRWMAGVDALRPARAFVLGLLLAGVNPKNLILTIGAGSGLAQLGPSTAGAVVSLIVFVVVASVTIVGPVAYYSIGGESAKTVLDELKDWLRLHNSAVMAVLFLVFGVNLIAKGIPPLT